MGIFWEEVLYPPFLDTIRGEYYSIISDTELNVELYNLGRRAVAAFKFPHVSLAYDVIYVKVEDGNEIVVGPTDDWDIVHPYFTSDEVTYREIEVIIAWMKVYWAESQASNADNFLNLYTDANIKTFSRANALDKYLKFVTTFKKEAKELEDRYTRVAEDGTPALGEVNDDK